MRMMLLPLCLNFSLPLWVDHKMYPKAGHPDPDKRIGTNGEPPDCSSDHATSICCLRVVRMLSESCQNCGLMSESCQRAVRMLPESCRTVVRELSENCQSCQLMSESRQSVARELSTTAIVIMSKILRADRTKMVCNGDEAITTLP